MAYTELTMLWSGGPGGTGYTKMRFLGDLNAEACAAAAERMRNFMNAFNLYIPSAITLSWTGLATIRSSTGAATGEVGYTPPSPLTCMATDGYAGGAGLSVSWTTGVYINGRKVRGRTYIVPLASSAFQTDGTPATNVISNGQAAANALVAGTPALVVASLDPTAPGGAGFTSVTGAQISDRTAILRSRRD